MSKASKSNASEHMQLEGYEGHFEDFGPYTVGFETYTADAELAPLFVGLPDDHCQCPHFGYVIRGRLKFVFAVMRTMPHRDTFRRFTPGPRSSSSALPLSCRRRSRSCQETWRPNLPGRNEPGAGPPCALSLSKGATHADFDGLSPHSD